MNTASWVGVGALLVAALSGTLFMILYTIRTRWWEEEHRAHLGFFTLALTLIFWVYVFRSFFEPGVFAWIRAVLFGLISVCMVWRLTLLIRSPRKTTRN
ncbi:putative phage holin [Amycolatopsis japonica]